MLESLMLELYQIGAVKFGSFTLKSGIQSPFYIDLRLIISYPQLLKKITKSLIDLIRPLSYDVICGVPYTALPLATAVSLELGIPMILRRKEVKDHGTKKKIEGVFSKGQKCLLIEDVITSGLSLFETIQPLEDEGLVVQDVVVLLNREQGGKKRLEEKGIHVHILLSIFTLLDFLKKEKKISNETFEEVHLFLKNHWV